MSGETLAWVVGRGGLLGSHVGRVLAAEESGLREWRCPAPRFPWGDPATLGDEIGRAAAAFAREVRGRGCRWAVLWCAGVGTVGAPPGSLMAEMLAWESLLAALRPLRDRTGSVFLASSAGGVYGMAEESPLTESSTPRPASAYGAHKLRMEGSLRGWARAASGASCLVGRISNLYGPGQDPARPRGLIARISRSIILHEPLNIFVSLDTIRDFLYAEDCARSIVLSMAHLLNGGRTPCDPRLVTKIFASGKATTARALLGLFFRLTRHRPIVTTVPSPGRAEHPERLCFRSTVWPHLDRVSRTELPEGIGRVHQHLLAMFRGGRLRSIGA